MEPINTVERRKAFWNFLLLFALCIAIILTMAFFSVRVPFSENKILRNKMSLIDKERGFEKQFSNKMVDISRMLDTIDRATLQQAEQLDIKATAEIVQLKSMVTDTMFNKELYNNVVRNLENLQLNARSMRKVVDAGGELDKLKIEVQEFKEKAQDNYTKYIECLTKK